MKLVQLLAKELKEWPEGVTHLTQSEVDNEIYNALEGNSEGSLDSLDHRFDTSSRHSERPYPIVSREQWQSEREKMNKPKWIRHRGGKQPVEDSVKVEYRMRAGDISTRSEHAANLRWAHLSRESDIMAYRVIEESKDQEIEEVKVDDVKLEMIQGDSWVTIDSVSSDFVASVFVVEPPPKGEEVKDTNIGTLTYNLEIDATEATNEIDSLVAKWGQIESPLKWRDAIIHCQAIIEDCEHEIERNINLLDAEGLMMQEDSKKAMQHYAPDVDMGDWRNWKVGDIIFISNDPDIKDGEYKVTRTEEYDYDGDLPIQVSDGWVDFSEATVKFIRRP